jgi:hypothetical protein
MCGSSFNVHAIFNFLGSIMSIFMLFSFGDVNNVPIHVVKLHMGPIIKYIF